ncbi:hypothetical protein LGQ03_01090 [Loktanella sp. TSTF-M6]|uniref:DUF304 domain-containing protein n=1 Tax=Loktanella gaetbuli TaxID=2881335 RepID=A0ABS8BQS3_9RHOB|nr:hypothetical protein [Loktanella gaetbuli]MCB5197826.1 hypothetical protein [Loktanella gaetbuli]
MSDLATDRRDVVRIRGWMPGGLMAMSSSGFDVEEAFWGYTISHAGGPRLALVLVQFLVLLTGALCAASGMTLLLLSPVSDIVFRSPLIFGCFAFSLLLMWYATRGLSSRYEIDTHRSELRRVVLNRTGLLTIQARYGFDSIANVYAEAVNDQTSRLYVRFRNGPGRIVVASGKPEDLEPLSVRLRRDMVLGVVQRNP